MYAVIEAGGKQHTVKPSSMIEVNHLHKEKGDTFETDKVLLLHPQGESVRVGQPYVKNAKVQGVVVRQFRGKKVLVFKQRRRKDYRRLRGHRQELTLLRIERIEAEGVLAEMPTKAAKKSDDAPKAAFDAKTSSTKIGGSTGSKTAKPKVETKPSTKSASPKAVAKPKETSAKAVAKPKASAAQTEK